MVRAGGVCPFHLSYIIISILYDPHTHVPCARSFRFHQNACAQSLILIAKVFYFLLVLMGSIPQVPRGGLDAHASFTGHDVRRGLRGIC